MDHGAILKLDGDRLVVEFHEKSRQGRSGHKSLTAEREYQSRTLRASCWVQDVTEMGG